MSGLYERKAKSQKKHPCSTSSSGAFKATQAPPAQKPGWKGPSYLHKKPKAAPRPSGSKNTAESTFQGQLLPIELQQSLLNLYRSTFPASNDFEALKPTLQEVKNALFDRDFDRAFGKEEYLEAYAIRWSPSRTLGYGNLLAWLAGEEAFEEKWVKGLFSRVRVDREEALQAAAVKNPAKVVCFGGGAAEIMAFAGMLKHLRPDAGGMPSGATVTTEGDIASAMETLEVTEEARQDQQPILDLHLVDTADWSSVIDKLDTGTLTAPTLSKYASSSAKAANTSLLAPGALKATFTQANVLESSLSALKDMIGPDPALLTLLFTLNELYSASIPKTTKFLLELTLAAPRDSLLLVVDSPGSYSETAIGAKKPTADEGGSTTGSTNEGEGSVADGETQEKKKYPMHWLMDHVLLEQGKKKEKGDETLPMWEKLVGEESRWFRLLEGLKYPVSLENMRFQVHLFRRR